MKTVTPTYLRNNIYQVLDRIIKTGTPQQIICKGQKLTITLDEPVDKLKNLTPHNTIVGDPDELISFDPSEWTELKNL
jgi:hypothetical protein